MAVPIPSFFKKTLQDIPEPLLETAVKKLKIDQLPVFKKFAVGKTASKTLYIPRRAARSARSKAGGRKT